MPKYRYVGEGDIWCPDARRDFRNPIHENEIFDSPVKLNNPVFEPVEEDAQ